MKWFPNKGSCSVPMFNKYRVSNSKPQGGNNSGSSMVRPTFSKFGKKHGDRCLAFMGVSYACGRTVNQLKNCSTFVTKG